MVAALGGNALLKRGEPLTAEAQRANVKRAAEALAAMGQDDPPDVILADFNLEGGDTGIAAIQALRAAAGQPIPAVMVTAQRNPQIARDCAAIGAVLVEKPVCPEELGAVLSRTLSRTRA